MQISVKDLATLVEGRIVGDENLMIHSPGKIEEATEGQITFLANPKYEDHLYSTQATAVLVAEGFQPKKPVSSTLIYVQDVYGTLSFLLEQFGGVQGGPTQVSDLAYVDQSAVIGENVGIGAFSILSEGVRVGNNTQIMGQVFVGPNVEIGDDVMLYPGVKIYQGCKIGNCCILHSNAVIGSDGFGFTKDEKNHFKKIPQIGNVSLADHVEVGANTVIDRATMGSTVIHQGAKLDNLIQIAHNVEIGPHSVIAAQAGIAGSTKIGAESMIGGQAGVAGHLRLAPRTMIQAGSGINRNIDEEGEKLYGYPAISYTQYLRSYAVFKELPQLRRKVEALEKIIKEIREK